MTNSQGKTESPKSVTDDLWSKPDETSTNEKIKELCPIVITTIDCRPTKFKDANGDILKVTSHSHSKDGPVHTVKLISLDDRGRPRLEVKDGVETEVLEGPERTIASPLPCADRRAALQSGNARAGFAGAVRGSSTTAILTGSALYIGLTSSVRGSALR